MKNPSIKRFLSFFIILVLITGCCFVNAQGSENYAERAQNIADGIINFKLKESNNSDIQSLIDRKFSDDAGVSSDWYIIALSQYGDYDFSNYEKSLLKYLSENSVGSAVARQKYALSLIACGSTDNYIQETLNNSIGKQGIMSVIFGLHLLNNGYSSKDYGISDLKAKLLDFQLQDGGFAVTGKKGDVDVTAMALQALAPYFQSDATVKSAVNNALSFLSSSQKSTGEFASYGVNNAESCAQTLIALSELRIDAMTDSRFIKGNNTLLDAIERYKMSDGSFCHKQNGASNSIATVQVLCSAVSYLRYKNGKDNFYILDKNALIQSQTETTSAKKNTAKHKITTNANNKAIKTSALNSENKKSASSALKKSTKQRNSEKAIENAQNVHKSTVKIKAKTAKNEQKTNKNNKNNKKNAEKISDKASENTEFIGNDNENLQVGNSEVKAENQVKSENKNNYKLWICLALFLSAVIICIVLFALKKRNIKNFILIFLTTLIGIAIVLFTNIQTPDEYYSSVKNTKNAESTVVLTIRCDTIKDKSSELIPKNGIILKETEFKAEEGDSVYDILEEAVKINKIHLETSGGENSVYVKGIANIYEFDYGDLSGWMYFVNGEQPSVSCDEYKIKNGDKIEWIYTCNLGEDITVDYSA